MVVAAMVAIAAAAVVPSGGDRPASADLQYPRQDFLGVNGRRRTGITTGVAATSNSASGHAASGLVDGAYLDYWDSANTTPVTITLNHGSAKNAAYPAINQREDSITQAATSSDRINAHKILTPTDNSTWTTVKSGNLPNVGGPQFIDIGKSA